MCLCPCVAPGHLRLSDRKMQLATFKEGSGVAVVARCQAAASPVTEQMRAPSELAAGIKAGSINYRSPLSTLDMNLQALSIIKAHGVSSQGVLASR